jgi:hypothetical protein
VDKIEKDEEPLGRIPAKMSSSSVASPKARGAKRVLTDLLAELKAIAASEGGRLADEIRALRKEMKARYADKSLRSGLLMRAASVIEDYCDTMEEEYENADHDEMIFFDEEIERLSDLVEDAEKWADIYREKIEKGTGEKEGILLTCNN